jgi:hypothetical protein
LAAGIFCSVLAVALGLAAAVVLVVVLVVFFDKVVDVVFLAVLVPVVDLVDEATGAVVLFIGVGFEISVVVLASVDGVLDVGVAVGGAVSDMGAICDRDGVDAVGVDFAAVVLVVVDVD